MRHKFCFFVLFLAMGATQAGTKIKKGQDTLSCHIGKSWGLEHKKSSIFLPCSLPKHKRDIYIAVIDTGVDYSHPDLKGSVKLPGASSSAKNYGMDFSSTKKINDGKTPIDNHGHGTHISGIIKSVFPEVKIVPIKYLNDEKDKSPLTATIKSFKAAIELGVDIINYSAGGLEPSKKEKKMMEKARKKGILVIAAAGNNGKNLQGDKAGYYPASYGMSNIISVGSHNQLLKMLRSSNYGSDDVHLTAPGFRIRSSLPGSRHGYLTGTSQSTAYVTAAAGLLMSRFPELSSKEVRSILLSTVSKYDTLTGKVKTGGALNVRNALKRGELISQEIIKKRGVATKPKKIIRKIKKF